MRPGIVVAVLSVLVASGMALAQDQTAEKQDETAKKPAATAPNEMPILKTQTYKGVLVDAACASQSCPVSSSTNQFALKLQDGRVLRFDLVGNQRVQDELKNNKKWSEAASSGKEIHTKVSGAVSVEKLIVSSVH